MSPLVGVRRRVAVVLVLLSSSFVPLTLAQSPGAPQPAAPSTVLYAHHDAADTAELTGWMNALKDDGDDTAVGPSASCANNPSGLQAIPFTGNPAVDDELWGSDIDRTYTLTLAPAATGALTLDASRPIKAAIRFGAGSCAGHPTIASTLKAGDMTLATASKEHTYTAGAPYTLLELEMPITATAIPVGTALVWTVQVTGTYYGAGFMGVADPQGYSSLDIPFLPTAAGAPPGGNSTSGTSTATSSSGSSSGTQGSVSATSSSGATASAAPSGTSSASADSTESDGAGGQATGATSGSSSGKGTPAPGLLLALVALAAALVLARRRA